MMFHQLCCPSVADFIPIVYNDTRQSLCAFQHFFGCINPKLGFTYPYIFPRVLAAATLNLSGRTSILTAPGFNQRSVFARSRSSAQPSPLHPPPRSSHLDIKIWIIFIRFLNPQSPVRSIPRRRFN